MKRRPFGSLIQRPPRPGYFVSYQVAHSAGAGHGVGASGRRPASVVGNIVLLIAGTLVLGWGAARRFRYQ